MADSFAPAHCMQPPMARKGGTAMSNRRRAAGFTLVEMMIVVAILTVLVVVALGAYRRYMDNARKTEVYSMFAEIRAKEEAYRAEFSAYSTTGAGESDFYPVPLTSGEPKAKAWGAPPGNWNAIGISPVKGMLYCGYTVVAGAANSLAGAGAIGNGAFNSTAPTTPWWYAVATCDNDGTHFNGPTYGYDSVYVTTGTSDVVFEADQHY
jgi:prepilin-type N-terminal cleavage/methylation domain-containing protein